MTDSNIQKITEALYKVTDRMDDRDAIKWRIRECALEFSDLLLKESKDLSFREEAQTNERKAFLFNQIQNMLRIISSVSYLARVNFESLLREYEAAGKISIQQSQKIEEPKITEKIEKPQPPKIQNQMIPHLVTKTLSPEPLIRQKKIISYLAEKKSASVGDLTVFFEKSVSEKTLQRDLGELVGKGQVRAEGEKRWRVYSMA